MNFDTAGQARALITNAVNHTSGNDAAATASDWREHAPARPAAAPTFAIVETDGGDVSGTPWHSRLPRVGASRFRTSSFLATLPFALREQGADIARRVVALCTHSDLSTITFTDLCEDDAPRTRAAGTDSYVEAAVFVEPHAALVGVAIEESFAAAIANFIVNGDSSPEAAGGNGGGHRLSAIGATMIEFLLSKLAAEFNFAAKAPMFRFGGSTHDALRHEHALSLDTKEDAAATPRSGEHDAETGGEISAVILTTRLRIGAVEGDVRLRFGKDALASLGAFRHTRDARRTRRARFSRSVQRVPLTLNIGTAEADLRSLACLMPGDAVVICDPEVWWRDGSRLEGDVRLRVGSHDERHTGLHVVGSLRDPLVVGTCSTKMLPNGAQAFEPEEATAYKCQIVAVMGSDARLGGAPLIDTGAAAVMPYTISALNSAAGADRNDRDASLAPDDLRLSIGIELAVGSVTPDELMRLCIGDDLDLEVPANGAVDIFAGDRLLARGVLERIGNRLCARILKVNRSAWRTRPASVSDVALKYSASRTDDLSIDRKHFAVSADNH